MCCHSFNKEATGQDGRVAHIFCENAGRLYTDTEHPVNEDNGRGMAVLVVGVGVEIRAAASSHAGGYRFDPSGQPG